MTDLMLRFPDEATAIGKLGEYRADGQWITASHTHALDPIGAVVLVQAVIDPETGDVITPATVDDGFHVNLRILAGDAPDGLDAYIVTPNQPARVWA